MGSTPSVAVVIPVRDGATDLAACLATILPEAERCSADVIVVDDASSDDSVSIAESAGARVIRMRPAGGPYAARNVGWRDTTAEVIAFTDVRNRAQDGWLIELIKPLDDLEVAVSGGHVAIGGDERIAHRLARRENHLDPGVLLADDFLPFVTTSSMAVRRRTLDAMGGFIEERSGSDADLCWRIQLAGFGDIALAEGSHMVCEPRSSLPQIWVQWRRYARAYVELRERFLAEGATFRRTISLRQRLRRVLTNARSASERDPLLELADSVRWISYELTYRRALQRTRRAGSA